MWNSIVALRAGGGGGGSGSGTYYTINGVVTSDLGADPILSDTVLDDYLRESDLPDGALLKDAIQTGETSTNQELVDNLLTINPTDYLQSSALATPSHRVSLVAGGPPEHLVPKNFRYRVLIHR